MSRGKKGKEKQNGDGHKKGGGKNGGSPGSRVQQARSSGGGNGSKPAKWKKPVPSGTRRCSACGGNVTPGNRAKHERRDPEFGFLFHPCAPAPLADLPADPEAGSATTGSPIHAFAPPAPKPAPAPTPAPQPTESVGTWKKFDQWGCTTPGCLKSDCYASEAYCYGNCGCRRPPMDQRPGATASTRPASGFGGLG